MRKMFGPERYRAVVFDQRGCRRSIPHASGVNFA
jgi:proline iminopeptidase